MVILLVGKGGSLKRIWIVEEEEFTGSMVSTWDQSWGLSRNERSGRWVRSDRRRF